MARAKIDRKSLKAPDEFVSFWTRLGKRAAENRRQFIAGGVAVVLVLVGVAAWNTWRDRQRADMAADFARIQKIAFAELLPSDGAAPAATDGVPHFKTVKERAEAAAKEADAFVGSYADSPLVPEAKLLKATMLLHAGRPDDALAVYSDLASSLQPRLRFLATEGEGYAHEAKGNKDQALAAWDRLAAAGQAMGGFYRDRALFHKARLLEEQGKQKDAEPIYRQILDEFPATTLRGEVSDRLAALASE